jgi:hypothetical protein
MRGLSGKVVADGSESQLINRGSGQLPLVLDQVAMCQHIEGDLIESLQGSSARA